MANKHILTAAAAALLLLGTAVPGMAAADNGDRVSTAGWTVTYVTYDDSGQSLNTGQQNLDSKLSIQADVDLDKPPALGDTITFTATMVLDDPAAKVDTVQWFVNGKCVSTSSQSSGGTVVSTYKLKFEGPSTVYAAFSGQLSESTADQMTYGTFEAIQTKQLTVGEGSNVALVGSQWAWSKSDVGSECTFTAPVAGEYRVQATAADGSMVEKNVELRADTQTKIAFALDGSGAFGTIKAERKDSAGQEDPSVVLTLEKILVDIIESPSAATIQEGQAAFFTAEADGNGLDVTYQWYVGTNHDDVGQKLPNATSATYSVTGSDAKMNGRWYSCVISNGSDTKRTEPVLLTVYGSPEEKPSISVQQDDMYITGETRWVNKKGTYSIWAQGGVEGAGELGLKVSLDGGKTWQDGLEDGATFPFDTASQGDITILATAYNTMAPALKTNTMTTLKLDSVGPEFTVSGNPSSWIKAPVKLTVKASDTGAGLHEVPYSWDGGITWTQEPTMPFEKNQRVNIVVRDALGNETTQTVDISFIDNEAPKVKVTGNPTTWSKEAATLKVAATDDVGLADTPYSWDGGKSWTKEATLQVTENQTVTLVVRDKAGNKTTIEVVVDKVDLVAPDVEVTGNPDKWVKGEATLGIAAEDVVSGLHRSPYSWDGGKTWTSRATKTVNKNGIINVVVRDSAGNEKAVNVTVTKIDNGMPDEFTISGVPTSWTNKDVVLQVVGAKDNESGLAENAYNWNNEGWTTKNSYKVTTPGTITVQVQDKAGNIRSNSLVINKIDRNGPVITGVSGIPETWQGTPATVTVSANDAESGLAAEPYSFDDGQTWQASPSYVFFENQAVGLKVKDAAGNITYQPFLVKNVDATPPSITVSYLSASDDRTKVVVGLFGSDNVSSNLLYCFNYQETYPELNVWTTANQQACEANVTITVACKDEMGNIGTKDITPTLYAIGGAEMPLFINNTLPLAGYTLGGVDGTGKGYYLDKAGLSHEYKAYRVGNKTVHGISVEVKAAPMGGGYLCGYAKLNGGEFPIYWNEACTQTMTQEAATGHFYIDASLLRTSAKTASLQVVLEEYETELKEKMLNSDQISCGLIIDVNGPVVTMNLDNITKLLTIDAKDALSGIQMVQYQVSDKNGTTEWANYTSPIRLSGSSKVTVIATDKVGNTSVTDSQEVTVASDYGSKQATNSSVYYYRTDLFDHYLYGTGKKNIGSVGGD